VKSKVNVQKMIFLEEHSNFQKQNMVNNLILGLSFFHDLILCCILFHQKKKLLTDFPNLFILYVFPFIFFNSHNRHRGSGSAFDKIGPRGMGLSNKCSSSMLAGLCKVWLHK